MSANSDGRGPVEMEDKVAVITGAASGIGLALARRAASRGMAVVMADFAASQLAAQVKVLSEAGARVLGVPTDVSCQQAVRDLADVAEQKFGPPWLLASNAGVSLRLRTWDVTHEDWSWVLGVNLFGVVHGIEAFLPGMLQRDAGCIINTASMAGLVVGSSSSAPYAASKHAVIGLSEVLYRELSALGSRVHVCVLCPGPVTTNIALSGRNRPERFGQPGLPRAAFDQTLHARDSLDPDELADEAFRAVSQRRFWVVTHPGLFGDAIVNRMKAAVDGRNPDASTGDPAMARLAWDPGSARQLPAEPAAGR
jgi:NAD(P)-dependent dehydrogenase (short-subunit alcohol dehydrogenase family)